MDTQSDTDLGMSAQEFYDEHRKDRTGPVNVARRLADISIPSLFPPENWKSGEPLVIPNQSINSHCVNTLSSKLMLGAFPPGLPMAKMTPDTAKMAEDIEQDPELYSEIVYALSRREATHRERLEATTSRWAYTHTMKLNMVTGNALCLWKDIDRPIVYDMHHYVVKRDASGVPLVTVLEDSVPMMIADEDIKAASKRYRASVGGSHPRGWEDRIAIYHVEKLLTHDDGSREYVYWQEVEGGEKVPDSEAYSPVEVPTMYPSGMIPDYGSDWYLPYCQDYEGDMQAVENFSSAAQDTGAASAWNVILVNPQGQTALRDVQDAENLAVIPGREEDIGTIKSQKGGDYQVVSAEFENATRRLGRAFLLHSAVQRSGERVTAEEWQKLTAELDEALGGIYSQIAQTTQKWFVLRFIHLHHMENKKLGELPEGLVKTSVVTGLDSIGQSSEYGNLMGAAQDASAVLTPEGFLKAINPMGFLRRIFAGRSVNADGLVKGEDQAANEQAQEQNQAMQQSMVDKATGPIAQEGAKAVAAMMTQQGESNG